MAGWPYQESLTFPPSFPECWRPWFLLLVLIPPSLWAQYGPKLRERLWGAWGLQTLPPCPFPLPAPSRGLPPLTVTLRRLTTFTGLGYVFLLKNSLQGEWSMIDVPGVEWGGCFHSRQLAGFWSIELHLIKEDTAYIHSFQFFITLIFIILIFL